jgi:hypothetical protein
MALRNSLNVTGSLTSNAVSSSIVTANTSVTSNVVYANTLTANTSVRSNVVFANTFCYANGTSIIPAPFTTGKAIAMSIVFGG